MPSTGPTTGEAFGGVQCSAVRPQTEPDLMAWDPGSRAKLRAVKAQGVVVVHYEARGCDVNLHVLPNCVATGSYAFSPYSADDVKIARNANELFAQLPVGAASLSAKLRGSRVLRTDFMMVGVEKLKIGTTFRRDELVGQCDEATHVVSEIYVGGFALAAGEARDLEGSASVFVMPGIAPGAGARTSSAVEHLQREGDAEACTDAKRTGTASPQCSAPLRIALMPLSAGGAPAPSTPPPRSSQMELFVGLQQTLADQRTGLTHLNNNVIGLQTKLAACAAQQVTPLREALAAEQQRLEQASQQLGTLDQQAAMGRAGIVATGPDGASYAVRFRDLEVRVNELKDQIRRSQTRLALLSDTISSCPPKG